MRSPPLTHLPALLPPDTGYTRHANNTPIRKNDLDSGGRYRGAPMASSRNSAVDVGIAGVGSQTWVSPSP